MRFLLDANLSPRLREGLASAGHEVRHVDDVGMLGATDEVIFDRAAADGDVLITADSDFSMLLAARGAVGPSVVLLRHVVWARCPVSPGSPCQWNWRDTCAV